MASSLLSVGQELRARGYVHGNIAAVLGVDAPDHSAWDYFKGSWDDLPLDPYMADGGRYRYRRYAEFRCGAKDSAVEILPHRAYAQTRKTNHLNGGIERLFAPVRPNLAQGEVLQTLLRWCSQELFRVAGYPVWFAQVFQNRITCENGASGKPTPEGAHRDGVEYVLTVMIDRHGVDGGCSILHEEIDHKPIFELVLQKPGDFLLNNDTTVLHSVTPITPVPSVADRHRDVLVAIFTHMDGDKVPVTG